MSSACFEPEGSSSGRLFYIQVWYSVFYMRQYKQSYRQKSGHTLLPKILIRKHAFCWFILCKYITMRGSKYIRFILTLLLLLPQLCVFDANIALYCIQMWLLAQHICIAVSYMCTVFVRSAHSHVWSLHRHRKINGFKNTEANLSICAITKCDHLTAAIYISCQHVNT